MAWIKGLFPAMIILSFAVFLCSDAVPDEEGKFGKYLRKRVRKVNVRIGKGEATYDGIKGSRNEAKEKVGKYWETQMKKVNVVIEKGKATYDGIKNIYNEAEEKVGQYLETQVKEVITRIENGKPIYDDIKSIHNEVLTNTFQKAEPCTNPRDWMDKGLDFVIQNG